MPFLDLNNDIKPYLGIPVANTEYDSLLTLFRDSVESAVLAYVETAFALTPVTNEILDSNGSDTIVPRNSPIVSVQAIYTSVESDGSGGNLLDPEFYRVDTDGITLRAINQPRGRFYVRIDYTYGYDGLPPEIKHAMLMAVDAEFIRKQKKQVGQGTSSRSKKDESESGGNSGGGTGWDTKVGLPLEVIAKLQTYKQSFEFPASPMATRNF
jgi:hypothetical protein